jgi:hypothetical protein
VRPASAATDALGIHPYLLAHHLVGQRVLHGLEQAVGQHDDHVLDALLGHQLSEQRLGIAAIIAGKQLPHLPHRQVTLKVDHQMLPEVFDQPIHASGHNAAADPDQGNGPTTI